MRYVWIMMLGFPGAAMGEAGAVAFDPVRDILETRCLECHTPEKAKGVVRIGGLGVAVVDENGRASGRDLGVEPRGEERRRGHLGANLATGAREIGRDHEVLALHVVEAGLVPPVAGQLAGGGQGELVVVGFAAAHERGKVVEDLAQTHRDAEGVAGIARGDRDVLDPAPLAVVAVFLLAEANRRRELQAIAELVAEAEVRAAVLGVIDRALAAGGDAADRCRGGRAGGAASSGRGPQASR